MMCFLVQNLSFVFAQWSLHFKYTVFHLGNLSLSLLSVEDAVGACVGSMEGL